MIPDNRYRGSRSGMDVRALLTGYAGQDQGLSACFIGLNGSGLTGVQELVSIHPGVGVDVDEERVGHVDVF